MVLAMVPSDFAAMVARKLLPWNLGFTKRRAQRKDDGHSCRGPNTPGPQVLHSLRGRDQRFP